MPSVRLAFCGPTRDVSPWLLRSLSRVGTFEAVCGDNADHAASSFHARWAFSDLAGMLQEAEPEGIILHQPPADRARLIKQCLAAGCGVLVTGAPGSAAACKRLASFSKLSGRVVLAAPPMRYAPAVVLARRLISAGRLSSVISMSLHSTWRGSASLGVGDNGAVSADQVFEAVDMVQQLIGPVQRVFAAAHDDGALVASLMTSAGTPVSVVLHSRGATDAIGLEMDIRGADGTRLRLDRDFRLRCGNGSRVDAAHEAGLPTVDPGLEMGFEGLVAEFRRRLQSGRGCPGLVGPVDSVVSATEAVLASAARGRIMVPKLQRGAAENLGPPTIGR